MKSRVSQEVLDKLSDRDWFFEQYSNLGKSRETIAKELGVSATLTYKWFKIHGFVTQRKISQLTKSDIDTAIDMYESGSYLEIVSRHFKVRHEKMKAILEENGVVVDKLRFSNFDIDEAISLYNSGISIGDIAKKFNRDRETIRKKFVERGIEIRLSADIQKLKAEQKAKLIQELPEEAKKYRLSGYQIEFFRNNPNIEWPLCKCGCGKKVLINISDPDTVFREFASVDCSRASKATIVQINREELVRRYNEDKVPVKILARDYKCNPQTIANFLRQEGQDLNHRRSNIEYIIEDILDRNSIPFKRNDRKTVYPKEIDFLLLEKNIGIEINGLYYHSFYSGNKSKLYHHDKFKMAMDKGVKLLQFWENDILDKSDIIESMIKNHCGLTENKIYGRNCLVVKLTYSEISSFCYDNHIQGIPSNATKGFGLTYNDELVAVIGYIKSEDGTIINRFCSKLNTNVVGGFSKLCKKLEGRLISYSSNDISDGNLYAKNGFILDGENRYDMWVTDYKNMFNRSKFMKKKMSKVLDIFDETKTELENLICNGYDVIYKSGTKKWIRD